MSDLRVLVLDIELAPMTAYIWSLKDQYVGVKQLKTDWYVIAWGAKWLGEPASKVIYRDQQHAKKIEDDKSILKELWDLLNEADVVITQNGEKFDGPKLNARFILNDMRPPKPYKHLDTYKLVRKVAAFTSNGLEYLTHKLCTKYRKLSHQHFPGLSLWIECIAGNKKAWAEMREYNVHDVLSTEELYMKIRAWAPESMPTPYISDKSGASCKVCGDSGRMQRRGFAVKNKFKYQRWQCQECGGWATGDRIK
jgi:DNA polymerase elongation subunit (family B)